GVQRPLPHRLPKPPRRQRVFARGAANRLRLTTTPTRRASEGIAGLELIPRLRVGFVFAFLSPVSAAKCPAPEPASAGLLTSGPGFSRRNRNPTRVNPSRL